MKNFIMGFLRRGFSSCAVGPIVLAILYMILQKTSEIQSLSVSQVCVGIFSLSALAFVAGGINAIYQIERLGLMSALLIHGTVLYVGYLLTYLLNAWLAPGLIPIIVFTVIFVVGYVIIWAIIYMVIKTKTKRLNEMLRQNQSKVKKDRE